jgi:hypothetical protein
MGLRTSPNIVGPTVPGILDGVPETRKGWYAMSVEVDIIYWGQQSLGAGQDGTWDYWLNSPPDNNHWLVMSSSPDNFPASLQILDHWQWTDGGNAVRWTVHWKNNGGNTVVFRAKGVIVPHL